jgi:hypothetical protein
MQEKSALTEWHVAETSFEGLGQPAPRPSPAATQRNGGEQHHVSNILVLFPLGWAETSATDFHRAIHRISTTSWGLSKKNHQT